MDFIYNPQEYVKQSGSQYGSPSTVNDLLYNQHRGFQFKDSTAFAYQQMAKREDNAFNVGLLNYMNEYNTPLEQMKRYQAAGLNPVDALGKTNTSAQIQSASGGSAQAHKTQEMAQYINLGNSIVDGVSQILDKSLSAKESLIKLKYLDQNENTKMLSGLTNLGILGTASDTALLKQTMVALSLLEKFWDDGISPNYGTSSGQFNNALSSALAGYVVDKEGIKDDSYYARMAKALLDLRKQNKETQEAQEQNLLTNQSKTIADLGLRHITGIEVVDKIINAILN